jgi:hypothetical protein
MYRITYDKKGSAKTMMEGKHGARDDDVGCSSSYTWFENYLF